jgi:hypothetical protein
VPIQSCNGQGLNGDFLFLCAPEPRTNKTLGQVLTTLHGEFIFYLGFNPINKNYQIV